MQPEDPLDSLAQRADEVKNLLPFASRPFVIELAGTPKSGKSTSVETLACPQISGPSS
jgi:pantothenate kinase